MPLDLEVQHLSGTDESARLFLRSLQDRGAVLVTRDAEPSSGPMRTPESSDGD
jgi:hypothetical protein